MTGHIYSAIGRIQVQKTDDPTPKRRSRNLEMDSSLRRPRFNIVSGQATSDALRKEGEVLLLRI